MEVWVGVGTIESDKRRVRLGSPGSLWGGKWSRSARSMCKESPMDLKYKKGGYNLRVHVGKTKIKTSLLVRHGAPAFSSTGGRLGETQQQEQKTSKKIGAFESDG